MNTEELFINENNLPEPLPKKEIYELIKKMNQGDEEAKAKIVEHNLRLVRYEVMHRFSNVQYDKKELMGIGILGLMKAIAHFDIEKDVKFASFATRCIDNEILMFLRKLKKQSLDVSLDEPLSIDEDGKTLNIEDILSNDINILQEYTDNETHKRLREIILDLPKREKEIVMLFFGFYNDKQYTQKEIASMLNLSQSYISRLIKKIVKKLGIKLKDEGIVELNNQRKKNSKKGEEKMPKKLQSIYEYFNKYTKEEIDIAISKLSEEEQKIVEFRYGGGDTNNLNHNIEWNKEYNNKFYGSIVPKLRRLLENPERKRKPRKTKNAIITNNEDKDLNIELAKESIVSNEELSNEYKEPKKESFSKEKCIEMLGLIKTPTFGQLLSTLSAKEAVIISLKLGLVDGKYFKTETIAQFLGITESEIREITRKVLLVYKENINAFLDSMIDTAIEMDMKR